ncbi:MAG: transposase, partial [Synergistaceae bacterium]|nr:transposase [Synergistaceae bacterium]
AKANANRDYHIFEEFAKKLIEIAQNKRINTPFELCGKFYAFDSTTIDLCLNLFWWAKFRSTKSGIKAHTLFDVVTQIPTYIHITNANVHDTQAMDQIPYEPNAYYIFDRGYFDLARLYKINIIDSFFIIRQKGRLQYEIFDGEALIEDDDGVISDQIIELTSYQSRKKYPGKRRRNTSSYAPVHLLVKASHKWVGHERGTIYTSIR